MKRKRGAFTLVELLVGLAVLCGLIAFSLPAFGGALAKRKTLGCMQQLRGVGVALHLYAADHQGRFPRSLHSAGANREPGWSASILPYLAGEAAAHDAEAFNQYLRCPEHPETNPLIFSYALNVHFELEPQGDDYVGSPQVWRRLAQVPNPGRTVMVAETRPVRFGDHLMCHQWSGTQAARDALAHARHRQRANYLFVDGHVETLSPQETFDPAAGLNLWNPSLAR